MVILAIKEHIIKAEKEESKLFAPRPGNYPVNARATKLSGIHQSIPPTSPFKAAIPLLVRKGYPIIGD